MVRILLCLLFASACLAQVGLKDPVFVSALRPSAAAPTPDILWHQYTDGSGTTVTATVGTNGAGGTFSWNTGTKSGTGYALEFNGSSDFYSSTVNYTNANIITVCAWVYFDATNSTRILWESSANWFTTERTYIAYIEEGRLTVSIRDNGYRVQTCQLPNTGAWVHLAVVYDGTANSNAGNMKVYYDGAEQSMTLGNNTKGSVNGLLTFSLFVAERSGGSLFFDGRIDDLRIYTGEVSAGNITLIVAEPK